MANQIKRKPTTDKNSDERQGMQGQCYVCPLGMALIGTFERHDRGYRSVLVLVDHAARYPNAVLLRSAFFVLCAKALFTAFTHAHMLR